MFAAIYVSVPTSEYTRVGAFGACMCLLRKTAAPWAVNI